MKLSGFGITTDLPPGWEGRITKRTAPVGPTGAAARTSATGTPGEVPGPIVHLANFALPEVRGDFGSGAVDLMGSGHVLITLFEYGPESLGKALFARKGMPTVLPRMFDPAGLQKVIKGQAGFQRFFTEADRAFCLYVVIGRHAEATALAAKANTTLRATRIDPR